MSTVIWWIRRDLRIQNNNSLSAAINSGAAVLPLFIIDPQLWHEPATPRQDFLNQGLIKLAGKLREMGNHLVIQQGEPLSVISRICEQHQIDAIFAEEDYSPYAIQRDGKIQKYLPLHLISGVVIHHPEIILKADGTPYQVFTPFRKVWQSLPRPHFEITNVKTVPPFLREIESVELPSSKVLPHFPAGEDEARKRLNYFMAGPIFEYKEERNRLDHDGTSSLSPYLRFGMLSIAETYAAADNALEHAVETQERESVRIWQSELIWREFYIHTLYHFPFVLKTAFQSKRRTIPWRNAPSELEAWQVGKTGFPVVDACMRQLSALGWMHNRGRMIAASFLVKDLLVNWQAGEAWFMQNLVDGDPAANNGGWQWSAGVGLDAAPYFRIFNPILQSKKFDPQGDFIRTWIPELSAVPNQFIHEPWLMPDDVQSSSQCKINQDYPAPIVDHQAAKKRVMTAFRQSALFQ